MKCVILAGMVVLVVMVQRASAITWCYNNVNAYIVAAETDVAKKYQKPPCELAATFAKCVRNNRGFLAKYDQRVFVTLDNLIKDAGYNCPEFAHGVIYRYGPLKCLLDNLAGRVVAVNGVKKYVDMLTTTNNYFKCISPYFNMNANVTYIEKRMYFYRIANWVDSGETNKCGKGPFTPAPADCNSHLIKVADGADGLKQFAKMFNALKAYAECIAPQMPNWTYAQKGGAFRTMSLYAKDPKKACGAPKQARDLAVTNGKRSGEEISVVTWS